MTFIQALFNIKLIVFQSKLNVYPIISIIIISTLIDGLHAMWDTIIIINFNNNNDFDNCIL